MMKQSDTQRRDRPCKILVVDPIGLKLDALGQQDSSEVEDHIRRIGGYLHRGPATGSEALTPGGLHFFYCPDLNHEREIADHTSTGRYDAVIAAATTIPESSLFSEGGVRIGAGTGNMRSASWGGSNGRGGTAPLMNTPGFNSRATAQMAFKALLRAQPGLPTAQLHARVVAGQFDTSRHLKNYPSETLEGQRIAILGFGHIGREMAVLCKAFAMQVTVYAHARWQRWCESEGFQYAASVTEAAEGARFLSIHTGLGTLEKGRYANENIVDRSVLARLRDGAVLINYDRAQLIDLEALREALTHGKVRFVCVDADVFLDEAGCPVGPLAPYVALARDWPDAFELMPHAAADTEHCSRVAGAKQAVDQIANAIRHRQVVNLIGDLPPGYQDLGTVSVAGVGKVRAARLAAVVSDASRRAEIRALAERLAAFWKTVDAASEEARSKLIVDQGRDMVMSSNRLATLMQNLGLRGPFEE